MKLFLSSYHIDDSAGGIPKVVNPLAEHLRAILSTENIYLFHPSVHLTGQKKTALFRQLKEFQPDLIHDHGAWLPFHLKVFIGAKLFKFPFIISPHGMLDKWAMHHKAFKKLPAWYFYQKYIFQLADAIVVNSQPEYLRIRELGFKNPIAIIENGIDISLNSAGSFDKEKAVAKQALYLSRINPVKRVLEMLMAWKNAGVYQKFGFILNIYGNVDDINYLHQVEQKIIELNLQNQVFLKGAVYGQDKWAVYAAHDFFVLPSYTENFGIVVLEALFSGIPVITTENTPWQHLENLGLGKTVSLANDSLQQAIYDYAENLNQSGKMTAEFRIKAHNYVIQNFAWSTIAGKYIDFYQWILDKKNKPDFVRLD